ncbi:MAG: hypothetical protein J5I52_04295 [Saprospiraceae bacterium]|nr:MAG: hypothetical protein UZ09_BCD002001360 [Bacteroidetes bacterium OLB9]MCO6463351.1 hypothetical protein [Saprospiraceae bacterium]
MLKGLKRWMFYKSFSPERSKKKKRTGINPLHTVAVLFDGTQEAERKLVHQFKKDLKAHSAQEAKSLAFINNRLPLDNVDYDAYNLKNVNWYGVPSGTKVSDFIQSNWDVLIFLGQKMLPHYEYIFAHSQANFIIGPSITRAEQYFDMIVDNTEASTTKALINKIIQAVNTIAVK